VADAIAAFDSDDRAKYRSHVWPHRAKYAIAAKRIEWTFPSLGWRHISDRMLSMAKASQGGHLQQR
jgi:hypothetical protein